MALPGRIFSKKAKSSPVTVEKGSLVGAAAGDGSGTFAPECSFREVAVRNELPRSPVDPPVGPADEKAR